MGTAKSHFLCSRNRCYSMAVIGTHMAILTARGEKIDLVVRIDELVDWFQRAWGVKHNISHRCIGRELKTKNVADWVFYRTFQRNLSFNITSCTFFHHAAQ